MLTALASGLLAVGAAAVFLLYAVHGRSAQFFGRSVWRGSRSRRTIALTFDDGPSAATLVIARYLESHGIRATFFVCGENLQRHPGVVRELHEAGHEIGNHTYHHQRLCPRLGWQLNLLSGAQIFQELARAQRAIEADAGVAPRLFRAPYGMRWFGVGPAQAKLGLTGAMWTVIGHDWEWEADRVLEHVLGAVRPGAIVCLHDGRETRPAPNVAITIEVVRQLVPRLKALGYGFETASEICAER